MIPGRIESSLFNRQLTSASRLTFLPLPIITPRCSGNQKAKLQQTLYCTTTQHLHEYRPHSIRLLFMWNKFRKQHSKKTMLLFLMKIQRNHFSNFYISIDIIIDWPDLFKKKKNVTTEFTDSITHFLTAVFMLHPL